MRLKKDGAAGVSDDTGTDLAELFLAVDHLDQRRLRPLASSNDPEGNNDSSCGLYGELVGVDLIVDGDDSRTVAVGATVLSLLLLARVWR